MKQQQKPKNKVLCGPMIIRINEEDIPYIFFSSDLHIQHSNILKFTQRDQIFSDIDDMFEKLMENMNSPLKNIPEDKWHKTIFFHGGDLLFGSRGKAPEKYAEIQNKLKYAKVYAVMGNHDVNNIMRTHEMVATHPGYTMNDGTICNPNWFWNNMYIIEIYRNSSCICTFTISHFPMDEFHGQFNVHGHLHSRPEEYIESTEALNTMNKWASTGKHFDCGCDNNNYMPVSLIDIMSGKTTIKAEYKLN